MLSSAGNSQTSTIHFLEDNHTKPESKEIEETPIQIIHLKPKPAKVVKWSEDVIDNEHMNKLKSNSNESKNFHFTNQFYNFII